MFRSRCNVGIPLLAVLCATGLLISFGVHGEEAKTASEHNAEGVAEYEAGNWARAAQAFNAAYQLTPENKTVRHNLCNALHAHANTLARDGDYDSAISLLEGAIKVEPTSAVPLVQLGSYFLRLDLVTDAVFRLEEAVELDGDNVDAHDLLGDAYYRNNQLALALDQWELVRKRQPNRKGLADKLKKADREEAVESNYRDSTSRHFDFSYAPGTAGVDRRRVSSLLERAYRDIGNRFGRVYPTGPVQVIIYTAEDFSEATQLAEHVGALYDGKIRVPLTDKAGNLINEAELKRRLYHEYVHVIVRTILRDNAPWWLNEGLAQMYSEEWAEADRQLLEIARDEDLLFKLANLEANQLRRLDPASIRLAYCQAHATMRHLYSRYGRRRLNNMLDNLAEGMSGDEALRQAYRRDYRAIDREVVRDLDRIK